MRAAAIVCGKVISRETNEPLGVAFVFVRGRGSGQEAAISRQTPELPPGPQMEGRPEGVTSMKETVNKAFITGRLREKTQRQANKKRKWFLN